MPNADLRDAQSIASWRNIELSEQSIRHHVIEGMKLSHLGVGFDEVLSCVMNEEAEFSKLKFVEGEAADNMDGEDPQARMDADFVLLTGTIQRLIEDLKKLLGGYTLA